MREPVFDMTQHNRFVGLFNELSDEVDQNSAEFVPELQRRVDEEFPDDGIAIRRTVGWAGIGFVFEFPGDYHAAS